MLLDANGKRPSEYPEMYPDAHCPGCKRKLHKKGGGHKKCIEHWAHYPDQTAERCEMDVYNGEKESDWHMKLKLKFRESGYEIEKVVKSHGKTYRIDAVFGRYFVELVNSMSSSYEQKAVDLFKDGHLVAWLFNGHAFTSFSGVGWWVTGSALRFVKRIDSLYQTAYFLYNKRIFAASRSGQIIGDGGIVTPELFEAALNGKFTSKDFTLGAFNHTEAFV
jgi:hypothetical protein